VRLSNTLFISKKKEQVLPLVLPVQKELEQVDFHVHHWKIEDWHSLKQRSHGPTFNVAGFQW
jgi:ubiquitin carboxyl-terminal hydrolase 7